MRFILKKVLSSMVLPPGPFILVFLAGGALLFGKRRRLAWLLLASGCALYFLSTELISDALLAPLERTARAGAAPRGDVIIVLGAGTDDNNPSGGDVTAGLKAESVRRIMCAYFIWKTDKIPIIYSGGTIFAGGTPEAAAARRFLAALGVPKEMIIEEGRSLDTRENVLYSKRLMEAGKFRKAVVVTSAYHAARAGLLFNQAGVPHAICPCGAAREDRRWSFMKLVPNAEYLERSTLALKEYFGATFYFLIASGDERTPPN